MQVFERGDGLWEVDARLTDVKTEDMVTGPGVRPAGEPLHDMLLRLVVNDRFDVLDAGSQTVRMPYPGHCDAFGDAYRQLIGLNLLKGFRWAVAERLGGRTGCTHITELAGVLPTAVIQALSEGAVAQAKVRPNGSQKPFQIDGCHALRSEGEVVRLYYPRWHQQANDSPSAAPGGPTHLSVPRKQERSR